MTFGSDKVHLFLLQRLNVRRTGTLSPCNFDHWRQLDSISATVRSLRIYDASDSSASPVQEACVSHTPSSYPWIPHSALWGTILQSILLQSGCHATCFSLF
ncbi:hypothetical protein HGRIS_000744 [Hohenbuehelia grisea]|uniref:Uncharacterized protein n=1 Tax=Hohenbuehelia grisea TaxID=104357 RepID=A0ABR3IPK3_9AGAR